MKRDLKNSVKSYVESKQLSEEQLNSLLGMVNAQKGTTPKPGWKTLRMVAVLASILIAAGLLWNVGFKQSSEISILIAEEVVRNHLKMKPLEVSSHSMDDMRAYFTELDFALRGSSLITSRNLQLLGGRYCSIQGVSAAQLRLQDQKTGVLETLYEAPYSSDLFKELPNLQEGQTPKRHYINGIGVDIWVDKGILFARTFSDDT